MTDEEINNTLKNFKDCPETFWRDFCADCGECNLPEVGLYPEECEKELMRQIEKGEWT